MGRSRSRSRSPRKKGSARSTSRTNRYGSPVRSATGRSLLRSRSRSHRPRSRTFHGGATGRFGDVDVGATGPTPSELTALVQRSRGRPLASGESAEARVRAEFDNLFGGGSPLPATGERRLRSGFSAGTSTPPRVAPRSYEDERERQTLRHLSDVLFFAARARLQAQGSKVKPVEVEAMYVNGRLFFSANQREVAQAVHAVLSDRRLLVAALQDRSKYARGKQKETLERHQAKLIAELNAGLESDVARLVGLLGDDDVGVMDLDGRGGDPGNAVTVVVGGDGRDQRNKRHAEERLMDALSRLHAARAIGGPVFVAGKKRPCASCMGRMLHMRLQGLDVRFGTRPGLVWRGRMIAQDDDVARLTNWILHDYQSFVSHHTQELGSDSDTSAESDGQAKRSRVEKKTRSRTSSTRRGRDMARRHDPVHRGIDGRRYIVTDVSGRNNNCFFEALDEALGHRGLVDPDATRFQLAQNALTPNRALQLLLNDQIEEEEALAIARQHAVHVILHVADASGREITVMEGGAPASDRTDTVRLRLLVHADGGGHYQVLRSAAHRRRGSVDSDDDDDRGRGSRRTTRYEPSDDDDDADDDDSDGDG